MAQAASGAPTRFVTLTVNPAFYDSPAERLSRLAWAWRNVVKRLRRERPDEEFEYLAVVEETKRGEPHLHILLRGPYIRQRWLADAMKELIGAQIVDIRAVRGLRQAVNYVAKYITKAPAQFGKAKRYWMSQHYKPKEEKPEDPPALADARWHVDRRTIPEIVSEWFHEGFAGVADGRGGVKAWLVGQPRPWGGP